ncbi:hypothetical protein LSM04_008826 [Trypanosoma melophagium]|uniref:uncharacterized protein n=1 Tax=Trypanosoma melophagium TaxID=715481 RepID=UPI00351AA0C6|nr:hypothetical protein LSM04_008826 [Trypanosoma melophagium]
MGIDHPPILLSDTPVANSQTSCSSLQVPQPWSLLAHHHRALHRYSCNNKTHKLSSSSTLDSKVIDTSASAALGGESRGGEGERGESLMRVVTTASNTSTSSGNPAGEVVLSSSSPDIVGINKEDENTVHSPIVSTVSFIWGTPVEESSSAVMPPEYSNGTGISVDRRVISASVASASIGGTETENSHNTAAAVVVVVKSPQMPVKLIDVYMGIREIFQKVRELHLSRCPLCAPVRSPNWWTTFRGERRGREVHGFSSFMEKNCGDNNNNNNKRKRCWKDEECVNEESNHAVLSSSSIWVESEGDSQEMEDKDKDNYSYHDDNNKNNGFQFLSHDDYQEEEEEKEKANREEKDELQLLRSETNKFLEHVYSRRRYLASTRPLMYDACPETHILWRECASLGGIVLLETLLLGL